MKKRTCIAIAAACLLTVVGAVGAASKAVSAGESASPSTEIKIDNFTFAPETLTVKAGTQITWTNHDDIPHTVVSDDNAFKSKALDTDEKFSFTPTKAGTYAYFCSIHPKMTAKLVVE